MPIITSEIQYRLSGGASNNTPATSLGGAKSSNSVPAGFFDDVSSAESAAGDTEYRCFYVHNSNASLTLQNAVVWIVSNTTGNRLAIGVGSSAINGTEQTVANEDTAPTSVTFSQPSSKGTGATSRRASTARCGCAVPSRRPLLLPTTRTPCGSKATPWRKPWRNSGPLLM